MVSKIKLTKIVSLSILFTIIFNMLCFATETEKIIYNNNYAVYTSDPLIYENGKYYISKYDAKSLMSGMISIGGIDSWNDDISFNGGGSSLIANSNSNFVTVNGSQLLYYNAVIKRDYNIYLSLELFAMVFSYKYEITDSAIYLYMKSAYARQLTGKIKLPNYEFAPAGGINLTIFAKNAQLPSASHGSFYLPYSGGFETEFSDPESEYYFSTSYGIVNVTIPEGENSAFYSLIYTYGFLQSDKLCLGYTVDNDLYMDGYYDNGSISPVNTGNKFPMESSNANIQVIKKKMISGTISLPNNSVIETDERFDMSIKCLSSNYKASDSFFPDLGSNQVGYSIAVPDINEYYTISLKSYSGIYKDLVYNDNNPPTNPIFNIACEYSPVILGKIKLPNGMTAETDLNINLILQDNQPPFTQRAYQSFVIKNGESECPYSIYKSNGTSDYIIYYKLTEKAENIFGYGHYSSDGTKTNPYDATALTANDNHNIDIPLIENRLFYINCNLPDGYVSDIKADINYNCGPTVVSETNIPLVTSDSNICSIRLPYEKNQNNQLSFYLSGDERYYKYLYYNKDKSTSLLENATSVNLDTSNINIEPIKQVIITGTAYANAKDFTACKIDIIPQLSPTSINTERMDSILLSSVAISKGVKYRAGLPTDVENFILGFNKDSKDAPEYFYNSNGIATDINNAEIINIKNLSAEYNFDFKIIPIQIKQVLLNNGQEVKLGNFNNDTNYMRITLTNLTNIYYPTTQIYLALYDKNKKLVKTIIESDERIYTTTDSNIYLSIPKIGDNIGEIKLFIWDNHSPLCETYSITNE